MNDFKSLIKKVELEKKRKWLSVGDLVYFREKKSSDWKIEKVKSINVLFKNSKLLDRIPWKSLERLSLTGDYEVILESNNYQVFFNEDFFKGYYE